MNPFRTFWHRLRSPGQPRAVKPGIGLCDTCGAPFGETLLQDIRFGFRMLWKNRGLTTTAVLSLALGIGVNTTVFCWIQNILLRPLPGVAKQEELVVVTTLRGATMLESLSIPDLKDQGKLTEVFAGVIGSSPNRSSMTADNRSEWIYGQIVTANFFDVLEVRPLLGRTFFPDEDQQPGGNPVLVISERFWRQRFAGDPGVIGRAVEINRHNFTIVGVVPAVFIGTLNGLRCDFWGPVSMSPELGNRGHDTLGNRSDRWLNTQARLRPGVSTSQAQAALDTLAAQLTKAYPESNADIRLCLLPFWKAPYGASPMMRPALGLLQAVSLVVLLIVAVNVANLLLSRSIQREKEIAIRLAMGAGRGRLIRQLLTESVLLSLLGGVLGVLLACWLVGLLSSFMPGLGLPLGFSASINSQTLEITAALALATGLIFGLMPALQTTRPGLNETLKEGGRASTSGKSRHHVLNSLVVSQIALALVLLVCAGLCFKGLRKVQTALGFDPHHLLYMGVSIEMNGDGELRKAFCQDLQQRVASLPGVEGVGFANWFPLGVDPGVGGSPIDVEGYSRQPNENVEVNFSSISPGYLAAMRIPLFDGRDFADSDDVRSLRVAIINEAMAKRFWAGQNPIGCKFKAGGEITTVVGLAKTGRYRSLNESDSTCFFYTPYRQYPYSNFVGFCVRTVGNPASITGVVRGEIQRLNPGVQVWAVGPMTDYIQAALMPAQIASSLLALLGVVALGLAAMGVYGAMAYVVGQRTHEFGIRMALGAQAGDVLRLVFRQAGILAVLGVTIGLALAAAVTRLLANFLYGVSPFDALTFTVMPLLLGFMTLVACWPSSRRATKVDPMVALRTE